MPAYCAPWPVNRNAIRGGSRRATRARAQAIVRRARGQRGERGAQLRRRVLDEQRGALREVRAAGVGGVADVGEVVVGRRRPAAAA